ncbi:MAG: RNA polymerase sigma factor [Bacteroidota bacterium]|nr:RNA polymerase sigma factor [Bacteroidota bacterium]
MSEKTDFELIEAFRNGDISGFNELVRRYQEKVYWNARRIIGKHEDADDVVQDVFIKVYERLKDFRGESNLYTWLYRITINVSINALRKKRLKDFIPYDHIMEEIFRSDSKTDALIEQQEYQTILERAINRLPTKQKVVFNMRYHDEMPYEEIAKILRKSVGGSKANYFQAVKNIVKYVRKEMDIEL